MPKNTGATVPPDLESAIAALEDLNARVDQREQELRDEVAKHPSDREAGARLASFTTARNSTSAVHDVLAGVKTLAALASGESA